jgi:hypothetical protein
MEFLFIPFWSYASIILIEVQFLGIIPREDGKLTSYDKVFRDGDYFQRNCVLYRLVELLNDETPAGEPATHCVVEVYPNSFNLFTTPIPSSHVNIFCADMNEKFTTRKPVKYIECPCICFPKRNDPGKNVVLPYRHKMK